jgi:hypothetical protein
MSTPFTIAQAKLAAAVRESNPSTVAKRARSTANTVHLLIHGAVKPTTRTLERYQAIGILPGDWFEPAPQPEPVAAVTPADVPGAESL